MSRERKALQLTPGAVEPSRRRHLLQDADLRASMIEGARAGVPVEVLLRSAGLSREFLQNWEHAAKGGTWPTGMRVKPDSLVIIREFCESLAIALAECEQRLVAGITYAASTSNLKTGTPEWRAAAWWLEHSSARDRWFKREDRHISLTTTGLSEQEVHVRALPEGELLTLTDPVWRELLGPAEHVSLTDPSPSTEKKG